MICPPPAHLRPNGPVQAIYYFYPIFERVFFGPQTPGCALKLRAANATSPCQFWPGAPAEGRQPFIQVNPCDLDRPLAETLAHLLHAMQHHQCWRARQGLGHNQTFLWAAEVMGIPAKPGRVCTVAGLQPPFTLVLNRCGHLWRLPPQAVAGDPLRVPQAPACSPALFRKGAPRTGRAQ